MAPRLLPTPSVEAVQRWQAERLLNRRPPRLLPTGTQFREKYHEPRAAHSAVSSSDNPTIANSSLLTQLHRLRTRYKAVHENYRTELCNIVASAVQMGLRLKKQKGIWLDFIGDSFWVDMHGTPKESHQKDAVRFVLRFVFGGGDSARKRASMYWRAVKKLLDEKVPLDKLGEEIKRRGGFKKLATAGATDKLHDKSIKMKTDAGTPTASELNRSDRIELPVLLKISDAERSKIVTTAKPMNIELKGEMADLNGRTLFSSKKKFFEISVVSLTVASLPSKPCG